MLKATDIKHFELMESLADKSCNIVHKTELPKKASFDENVLKLCSGLKEKGFHKQADDLEERFVLYKAAKNTHLYRAHDEDGEDLINAAHPDGDPNMGDGEHGDVETILSRHKKMVDIVNKAPTGKLGQYVNYCKIALAGDEFENKISEFIKTFLPAFKSSFSGLLSNNRYLDAKLPNGKTVRAYKLQLIPAVFTSVLNNLNEDVVKEPVQYILGKIDSYIKNIFEVLTQIDAAIDEGNDAFDNKSFPDQAYAQLSTYREMFMSIYTAYHKNYTASAWHGQFINTEKLNEKTAAIASKLNSIAVRIDRHILGESELQKFPKFIQWASGMKAYISSVASEVVGLNASANKYIDDMSKVHKSAQALIDGNKLREFLTSSKLLSIDGLDKTTNDANKFLDSIYSVYGKLLNMCKESIYNTKIDDQLKSNIMKHFEA